MRVFVIGKSGIGKTTLSQKVAAKLNMGHVQASWWLKGYFKGDENGPNATQEMTECAISELKKDHLVAVKYLNTLHLDNVIIDGVRNVIDFAHLFRPNQDMVVFVGRYVDLSFETEFDRGVMIIQNVVNWLLSIGMVDYAQVVHILYVKKYPGPTAPNKLARAILKWKTMLAYQNP